MPTVAVIDDSKFLRITEERLLTRAGYLVVSASDGQEALALIHNTSPDLIVLDMVLPILTGTQVLERLKADPATVHIPVIVVSGLSQKDQQNSRDDGAAAFLDKEHLLDHEHGLIHVVEELLKTAKTSAHT